MGDMSANGRSANVLVAGGAGYIGSHTCKALAAAGFVPVTYDNLVRGHLPAVRWGPFEHGDILDSQRLAEVVSKYRPRTIIHFAAYAYIEESVCHPGWYYRNNVSGSLALIIAALRHGVSNIIYSSSCAVFGIPSKVPVTEDAPKAPISPYGMTKLIVEQMLSDFHQARQLNWMALRYFNAAGADPDREIGELHSPEPHIIPRLFKGADEGQPFTIAGTDYDTPDGTCIRDYVHVSDLAEAHVKALSALEAGAESGPFNLGAGKGYSVREVIETVRRVTGMDVPFDAGPRRPGDPPVLVSDATRARDLLGWEPTASDIDHIVRTAWDWFKSVKERGNIAVP